MLIISTSAFTRSRLLYASKPSLTRIRYRKSLASQERTNCAVALGKYEKDCSRVGATSHKCPAPSRLSRKIMAASCKFFGCSLYAPLLQVGSDVIASAGKKSCMPRRPALGNGEEINGTTPRMVSGYCTPHCHAWRPP